MRKEDIEFALIQSAMAALAHTPKHSGEGRPFIRKYRRHRDKRNEMAFQSRKRNRK